MARLLFDNEWFEQLPSGALYEIELERILIKQTSHLFPGYYGIPFKKTVSSEHASARADYALVDRAYRSWWVVEVELAHHSRSHVETQVETLLHAHYPSDLATYLAARREDCDVARLRQMLLGAQPNVLVIVNEANPAWAKCVARLGAKLAVFEIFRSDRNRHIFRFNGYRPSQELGLLSLCSLDPTMPRLMRLESPASILPSDDGIVRLLLAGRSTSWSRLETGDTVFLNPKGSYTLSAGVTYEIVAHDDNSLELRVSGKEFRT